VPVIALVPQEHDFDAQKRPSFAMCYENCEGNGGGGSSAGGSAPTPRGLYLTAINFNETHESWLKGAPEFEFHIYGEIDNKPEQLTCTGERASHGYHWNADQTTWRGSVALFTEADINHYLIRNPKGVFRIVAWEDDDKPCVPVANSPMIIDLVKLLDATYKGFTAVKADPEWLKGVRGAAAAFGLAEALRNWINGEDDFIGLGIERSIVGWAPGNYNLVLKGEGAKTNGDFDTVYRK
ncbi:MAG TPA: hypothetical protein PLL69_10125, partial [Gemmatimonadales bacterium]|nr:hypothetical protein [Gemmatimonadales bacterium]